VLVKIDQQPVVSSFLACNEPSQSVRQRILRLFRHRATIPLPAAVAIGEGWDCGCGLSDAYLRFVARRTQAVQRDVAMRSARQMCGLGFATSSLPGLKATNEHPADQRIPTTRSGCYGNSRGPGVYAASGSQRFMTAECTFNLILAE
jgi:hypothetical protein